MTTEDPREVLIELLPQETQSRQDREERQLEHAQANKELIRNLAHEIKNPLTPIALSAERILRHLNRTQLPPEADQLLRECASTILEESASVKRLVDEFDIDTRPGEGTAVLAVKWKR